MSLKPEDVRAILDEHEVYWGDRRQRVDALQVCL